MPKITNDRPNIQKALSERTFTTPHSGKYLDLAEDLSGWEFAPRKHEVVCAIALTENNEVLLTKQHRIPLNLSVIDFPAGLVGDEPSRSNEGLLSAVQNELAEEVGAEGKDILYQFTKPTSPGLTDERVAYFLISDAKQIHSGGGVEGENITVHKIPIESVLEWLTNERLSGALVDPKVDVGLRLIEEKIIGREFYSPILGHRVHLSQDKARALLLGTAIGDALGLALETMSPSEIREKYGWVTSIQSPGDHKWFKGCLPGEQSDDTQLTLALMAALNSEVTFNAKAVAEELVNAMKTSTLGWGSTTKDSVDRLAQGVSPKLSGIPRGPHRGTGNGVAMRIAPLALYAVVKGLTEDELVDLVVQTAQMTHATSLGVSSGLAQVAATLYCLSVAPEEFNGGDFIDFILRFTERGREFYPETLQDDITVPLSYLKDHQELRHDEIRENLGDGGCYAFTSIPFTYAYFLRNNGGIAALYDVINAGGDTDTNGAMVGALLGALHGTKVFPENLVSGVLSSQRLKDSADLFSFRFGIKGVDVTTHPLG